MCISMAGQCSFLPDLRLQLAIKLLDFMRRISRSDVTVRASGEISSEAGGRPAFATGMAQFDVQGAGAAIGDGCGAVGVWNEQEGLIMMPSAE
jgi:hypothetical protein